MAREAASTKADKRALLSPVVDSPACAAQQAQSTLAEARFFADGGFDDMVYAVPLSRRGAGIKADALRELTSLRR